VQHNLFKANVYIRISNKEVHSSNILTISQEEQDREKQRTAWKAFQLLLQRHFEVTKIPQQELHPDFCSSDIIVLKAVKRHLANRGASVVTAMQ
jgi:hypothetical protein